MNGIWILLLLILTAALPAIIVFFWFRARKPAVTLPWFLASLAAGIVSVLISALLQNLIQNFFPAARNGQDWLWLVFFGVFVRIALVEEASRLVTVIPLLKAGSRRINLDMTFGACLGLAAGLGFAAFESAIYGMADINIALLRAFTAAPLHGACGIRTGAAVSIAGERPAKALSLLVFTVLIHGTYNLIIVSPPIPSLLAVPAALAALFSSLPLLKSTGSDDERIM
jgi:RsiW-degrading membrane proteinase PrsW (M82 family)